MAAKKPGCSTKTVKKIAAKKTAKPTLLAGDNPQIAKGEGNAPVQAYIAAVPGWKRHVCRRVDAIVTKTVPDVRYLDTSEDDTIDEARLAGWI